MRFAARSLALILITSLAACSGGGASAPGSPVTGASAKPTGKPAKVGVSIHVPGSLAGTSASTRRSTSGSARPKLVSPASNGLAVLMYSDLSKTTLDYENDFDISGKNTTPGATCTDDATGGGRTCTTTISEPAAQYDFVIETFASAPSANGGGFGSAPSLDEGDAGLYTLSTSQPTTISVTLGGTVTAIKLSVPTTFQPYGPATNVPIGLTALDAANEVIVSSDPYSSPITLGVTSSAGNTGIALSIAGGSTSAQVTSTMSSDVISLRYPGGTTATAGEVISISASSTAGASAAATIAPLYLTASPTQVIAQNPGLVEIAPASGTQATLTFTEGSGSSAYSGPLNIVADPQSLCVSSGSTQASASSPILFHGTGAYSTTPPAITATNGVATLGIETGGYATPGSGCIYDISDTSGITVQFTIAALSYTRCPGNDLYVNFDSPESSTGNEGLQKYTLPLTSSSTPAQLEGNGQTVWLSFDPSCNAYITNYFSTVAQYQSPYTTASSYSYGGSANTDPYGAAADGYGHLFVDQSRLNSVVEVQMSNNAVLNTLSVPGPYSIAFDSNANLYVGGSQGIYEFAPPYMQSTLVRTILTSVAVQGIAFDASNDLYAVGNNSLTVLAPPYGTANVTATNTTGFSTPLGLAIDASGNVYVPNYGNSTITAYAPPYTNAPYVTLNVAGALPDSDSMGP